MAKQLLPYKQVITLAVGAIFLALTACSDVQHDPGSGNSGRGGRLDVSDLSFKNMKDNILQPKCISCHAKYNDYNSVVLELDGILDSIEKGRMPKGKSRLPESDIDVLRAWINEGAPFKKGQDDPELIALKPTWESLSARVFQPHCVACHSSEGQVPWVDFTTYENVIAMKDNLFNTEKPRDSYMVEVILDPNEPMPPLDSNIRELSQEQIRALLNWIGNDLPEN